MGFRVDFVLKETSSLYSEISNLINLATAWDSYSSLNN